MLGPLFSVCELGNYGLNNCILSLEVITGLCQIRHARLIASGWAGAGGRHGSSPSSIARNAPSKSWVPLAAS